MLNKRGSFFVDALMALVLISLTIFLLSSALMSRVKSYRKERIQDDLSNIQEEAKRLYLDRDVSDTDDSIPM